MSKLGSLFKGVFAGTSFVVAAIWAFIGLILGIIFFPAGLIITLIFFVIAGIMALPGLAATVKTVKCPNCGSHVAVIGNGLTCQGCGTRFVIDSKTLEIKKILN